MLVTEDGNKNRVMYYTLRDEESLADVPPPILRVYAGGSGFVRPRLDEAGQWAEDAADEEIAAWDAAHPAPEPETPVTWDALAAAIKEGVNEV